MPGDAIRDSGLTELTVLAVELDTTPQLVHNLEVAGAHTYFAGELEAWGHNGKGKYKRKPPALRKQCSTRKKARELAKKAGKGKKPILHYDGPHGPHYHPDLPKSNPKCHDHYYFPKGS